MIRSLYPEIADRVQSAIAREGRFMLPDIALIEHIIDLVDDEVVARVDAAAAADLHPHDATPIGPSPVVPMQTATGETVANPLTAAVVAAPVASTDETAHASPQG